MTKRKRRNHSPVFKAKVALAAVRGERWCPRSLTSIKSVEAGYCGTGRDPSRIRLLFAHDVRDENHGETGSLETAPTAKLFNKLPRLAAALKRFS